MTAHLLDVNALIALLDASHVHHDRAHAWFDQVRDDGWFTCPTTQNGLLRIVSNPRYPNSQVPAVVADSLRSLLAVGQHTFVPDSVSLLEAPVDDRRLLTSTQVTDTYLLALAVTHQARLATFDTRLKPHAVTGGAAALAFIP